MRGYLEKVFVKVITSFSTYYYFTVLRMVSIRNDDVSKFPTGTETDIFAGNRACKCLEGHYRTHMFKECFKCGQGGLKCQDDYASLKSELIRILCNR